VIVGSGFGGSITANRLARADLAVLVLERGPWRNSLPVRAMGIADRSPFPYRVRFATHLLRTVHAGRDSWPGKAGKHAGSGSAAPGQLEGRPCRCRPSRRLVADLGRVIGTLHRHAREFRPPPGFTRPALDIRHLT
jgi:choline dehydrogenase-like flavoprotein